MAFERGWNQRGGGVTLRALVAASLVLIVAGPTVAGAARVYQGSDYADDHRQPLSQRLEACDRESDGHSVHADYTSLGSGWIKGPGDSNGANNSCASTNTVSFSNSSYPAFRCFRAVEAIPWEPDQFSAPYCWY